jgi:hypothetical protein
MCLHGNSPNYPTSLVSLITLIILQPKHSKPDKPNYAGVKTMCRTWWARVRARFRFNAAAVLLSCLITLIS